jgi:hypothetical protein
LREEDAASSYWSDPFLKQLLNSAYRLRCGELHIAYEGFFVLVAIRDLVASQNRYSWPPGFQRLSKLELVRTDERRVPVQRYERHEEVIFNNTVGDDDSYLPTYRPVGSGFELEPGPEQTVTNGLRMEYFGIPMELTSNNDELNPDFPELYDELLVLDTAVAALHSEQAMEGNGLIRTIEKERNRWEQRWEQYIDGRIVSRQQIAPFISGYRDA